MNHYLRNFFGYFDFVLHPFSGAADKAEDKGKEKIIRRKPLQLSPECYNIRGGVVKKQDKARRNPAP